MTTLHYRFYGTWARPLCGLGLALLVNAAMAEELPRSAACRTALDALDRAEAAIAVTASASSVRNADADRQRAVAKRLQPLRERVGRACLGGLTTSAPPSQRTWVVPTPARPTAAAPTAPRAQAQRLPDPPPRAEAPVMVSNCNAATCLGSDGSTLTRIGPNLMGPRGLCTVQGAFLRCP